MTVKKILFVGSFKKSAKDGSVGGQMFACKTLLESDISNKVDWVLLDSTADSNMPLPITKRAWKAVQRIITFIRHLCFSKIEETIIFTADSFSFLEKGSMALLGKLFGKRVILAPRSGILVQNLQQSTFFKWFIPFVFKRVDIIICQGESWERLFQQILPPQHHHKLRVIPNWIDVEKYNFQKTKPATTNQELNVLFLSWVIKDKGIFDLIDAASQLPDNKLKYTIAGKGADLEKSKELVASFGLEDKFDFLGWVVGDAKMELLQTADIYVLPSYFEGYPNSLMEAMASGIASVSTDVGSIPDLIKDDKTGIIIKPGDSKALADALHLLSQNHQLRQQMGSDAQLDVSQNNDIASAVSAFKKLLQLS